MVTIQAHRNAIGSHYDKASLLSSYGFYGSSFIILVIHYHVIQIENIQAVISDKLLQDGDIESNRGPTYSNERVVKFHFIKEIENCLVRLQAFSVHVILYMLCVGFR